MTGTTICGGSFGSGGVGSTPFGSGSVLAIASARQTSLSTVLVTFNVAPRAFDRASVFDALNPLNWSLISIDPTDAVVRLAQWAVRVTGESVEVTFDGPLTDRAVYEIVVDPRVTDAFGHPMSACNVFEFLTVAAPREVTEAQASIRRSDLANPQISNLTSGVAVPLGTYQLNDRGDFALESGRPYLKKRVFRRAFTAMGDFFHLPNYGFAEPPKGIITPSLLQRMQSKAQSQLLREPDVVTAAVSVQNLAGQPNMVVVTMKVTDVYGVTDTVTANVDLTEGF